MSYQRFVTVGPLAIAALAGLWLAGCSSPVESQAVQPGTAPPASSVDSERSDELDSLGDSELCGGLDVTMTGNVAAAGLSEASGLAGSVSNPGLVWATNDSGNASGLFALELDGVDRGFFPLVDDDGRSLDTIDVEDLATDAGLIYIADIGDNNGVRDNVTVLVVEEPVLNQSVNQELTVRQTIELRYPGGPRDAEAILVDPVSGDLIIFDKDLRDSTTRVFVASPPFSAREVIELSEAGSFDLSSFASTGVGATVAGVLFPGAVTAADITSSGSAIGVRTYGAVWLFERKIVDGVAQSVVEALQGQPCEGASAAEPQGESLAFLSPEPNDENTSKVRYLTISEGDFRPIYLVAG